MYSIRQAVTVTLLGLAGLAACGEYAISQEQQLRANALNEPTSVRAATELGEYYFHKKQWATSATWLTKAFVLSKGDQTLGYDLAVAWMNAGSLEKAKAQVGLLLQGKDSASLHTLMAEIDDRGGEVREAALEYRRAAEIEQTEERIFDLATYLIQHKQYVGALDEAVKFYRYGTEKYPRSARLHVGLGVALYASSEYDEAVKILCEAVDLDPKDTRPLQFLGRASRVSPELAPEVDGRLRDFAARYPENAAANYFYALAIWERQDTTNQNIADKVEKLLRKAARQEPGWYEPHYQLGVVFESQHQYPQAISEMRRAVHIDPDFIPGHYRLGVLYQRVGNHAEAQRESAFMKRSKAATSEAESRHVVTQ